MLAHTHTHILTHVSSFRPCFVFRHPTGLVGNVFLQPFTINVWYCVIVFGVFIIGTTSFISKREGKNSGKIRFVNLYITLSCRVQPYSYFFLFTYSHTFISLSLSFFHSFPVFGDFLPLTPYIFVYHITFDVLLLLCVCRWYTEQKLRHKRRIQWQAFIDKSFQDTEERAIVVESIDKIEAKRRWQRWWWWCDCNAKSTADTQTTSNKWQHVKYSPVEAAWSMDGQTGYTSTPITF